NTALIYMESPGSATFEVQDIPAICKLASHKKITTIIDNTWSAGLLFKPLEHGCDVSLQSCTKYIGGHSDVNLGVIIARNENLLKPLRKAAWDLGVAPAAEDLYLALRGLRSLNARMKQNAANAATVIEWMQTRDEFTKIYYPALKEHKGHEIWKRDFKGANGLFSFVLQAASREAIHGFINALELFPLGSSWGGYESLCQPQYLKNYRSAVPWNEKGACFRFQIGLEDPQDLIKDIDQALKIFNEFK
ncbi:MAG: trans-sulfuration enzyme family protein, partial [Alphaproteobacteria bacterium]